MATRSFREESTPRLDAVDMHALSERGCMELPPHYTKVRLEDLAEPMRELRGSDVAELAAITSDAAAGLSRRFAAGTLLGLLGDPRIEPLAPAMVNVPGGAVRLGLDPGLVDAVAARWARFGVRRAWIAKEAPAYEVEVAPYRIGRYPVTNLEYLGFLSETAYPELPTSWALGCYPVLAANHPVHSVTPAAADAYAAWIAAKTGRRFRLPAEREWELAAAGPSGLEFPWGDTFLPDAANTVELGLLMPSPVGIFPEGASPHGALDMAGNVEELVADTYRPYPGGELIEDWLYENDRHYRVARGGSFARFADLARCKRRHGPAPGKLYVMGFRLAEDGNEPARS